MRAAARETHFMMKIVKVVTVLVSEVTADTRAAGRLQFYILFPGPVISHQGNLLYPENLLPLRPMRVNAIFIVYPNAFTTNEVRLLRDSPHDSNYPVNLGSRSAMV
jgi:hypothetical protein